ncbi:MAG: glycosyltransferase family 9 protein [Parachlamydiales bacterium]|jgi:hypothetical protein
MEAGIITSKGLGDGLIMSILACHLHRLGYRVTLFNPHLEELSEWFPLYKLKKEPRNLPGFDWLFCQHSNTGFVEELKKNRKEFKKCSFIYPSFDKKRHLPLGETDFVCQNRCSLADNLKNLGRNFLNLPEAEKETGIRIPPGLVPEKYPRRILIHPTATCPTRTWERQKFFLLAEELRKRGFELAFIVHASESPDWQEAKKRGFLLPSFKKLTDLAAYIFESKALIGNDSGPAHLASLLGRQTLIVTNDPKRLALWRPGWKEARIVFPPAYMPNFKYFRWKFSHWQLFTGVSRVLRAFDSLDLPSS